MLNRWIGILSTLAMLLANAALIRRDVLPDWFAGDPPPTEAQKLLKGQERQVQVGIYDAAGRTLGHSWTRSSKTKIGEIVRIYTTTLLHPLHLPGGVSTPRVRVETELTYQGNLARVDELRFQMFGLGIPVSLHCAALPTGDFPCDWQVGPQEGKFGLDSTAPAVLGDVIRPFDRLPDLYVGRSWRLKLLDPLAQILPQLDTAGIRPDAVTIKVTGVETIEHQGQSVEAFVVEVEGGGGIAWVAPDGSVLRQEVNLPLLGRLILLDEIYSDAAQQEAARLVPNDLHPASEPAAEKRSP